MTREQKLERAVKCMMETLEELHVECKSQSLKDSLNDPNVYCSCADCYRMGHEALKAEPRPLPKKHRQVRTKSQKTKRAKLFRLFDDGKTPEEVVKLMSYDVSFSVGWNYALQVHREWKAAGGFTREPEQP